MRNDDNMEDEGWEDEDYPDDSEFFTAPCPSCGAEIHEDTPHCPICGEYITQSGTTSLAAKPSWYRLLAVLGIVAVIVWCLFYF